MKLLFARGSLLAAAGLILSMQAHAQATSARVVVGRSASVTDSKGQVWQPDTGLVSGASSTSGCATSSTTKGTTEPGLYKGARYGSAATSEMTFTLTGLAPGVYNVSLLMADCAYSTAGARVFNVQMQGATVMTNVDIAAQAPGANTALVKTAQATVTSGTLTIKFLHVTNNPFINAIQATIVSVPPRLNAPATLTATLGPLGITLTCTSPGTYTIGPLTISCAQAGNAQEVSLTWKAVTTCTQPGGATIPCTPSGYNVYRGTTSGVYSKIASTPATAYADTTVVSGNNTTYVYVVTAYLPACAAGQTTACGESSNSNEVSALVP